MHTNLWMHTNIDRRPPTAEETNMPLPEFDVVIRSGTVIDGSGAAARQADIAVRDGKIVVIGEVGGTGREEIDASGQLVTPGFVDIHTHYDGQVTWDQRLQPSSSHGVTTVIMGNCGVGFAPCRTSEHETLIRLMEGVEDIPEIVMTAGIPWNWETFPEYLDALEQRRCDVDFAAQVPHSAVRVYVMGDRGADREEATREELSRMSAIVSEAVRAGAFGVTSSQNWGHRTAKGELAPSVGSSDDELIALAQGLKKAGGGVFQIITNGHYGADPHAEMALIRKIAEVSGRPVSFSLAQKAPHLGQPDTMLDLAAQARANGLSVKAQVFPRPIGLLFGLELSLHPFRFHPSYLEIQDLPLDARVQAMRQPERRRAILSEQPVHSNPLYLKLVSNVDGIYPLNDPPDYEPSPQDALGEQARRKGVPAAEIAYDLLLENNGNAILFCPSSNYAEGNLEAVRKMMLDDNSLIGLGDGGAHYGMICDSSFPTTLMAYWSRDRPTGRLPIEWAIKSLSLDNARAMGLNDRGLLAPGYKADINVIDLERLQLGAPRITFDLPAGGRRLTQDAHGYTATMVSGEITYRNGQPTRALPGRLVRNEIIEPAATVMLLRDGDAGLEVFLMRRAAEASVLGGAHVFPGGKLDPADRELQSLKLDRTPEELQAALGESGLGTAEATAIHVAALRELFEESGVLLASDLNGPWQSRAKGEDARGRAFNRMAHELGLELATRAIVPWSRWITPVIPGTKRRRFDTRFFVALMPPGQTAEVADHESTLGRWFSPATALRMYWAHEMDLAPPQIMTLSHLTHYASAAAAFEAARSRSPALIEPRHTTVDGQKAICYPGDADHPVREAAFPSVSRLMVRNGRFEPIDGIEALLG
jgi:N-acyl-D-amino-acid deacylase